MSLKKVFPLVYNGAINLERVYILFIHHEIAQANKKKPHYFLILKFWKVYSAMSFWQVNSALVIFDEGEPTFCNQAFLGGGWSEDG